MQFKYSMLAASMAMALSLTGCGGSDGGSNGDVVAPGGLVITAMDGYLKNALVCSDINEDGKCDAGEVLGLTDENGKLEKEVSADKEAQVKAHPIVIKVLQPFADYSDLKVPSGIYTVDMDHEYQAMDKDIVFRAPAGSAIASPITDLIVAEMNNNKTQEEAEASVQGMLSGLTAEGSAAKIDLYADYLEEKEMGGSEEEKELAIKLHKTAQILTETQSNTEVATEVLDAVIADVVEKTIVAVEDAEKAGKLQDPNYKPSVPVTKAGEEAPVVSEPVVNYQATIDQTKLDTLEKELAEYDFITVIEFADFTSTSINGLITDQDQTSAPVITITNVKKLAEAGLAVSLKNGILTVSGKIDSEGASLVKAGKHFIELAADDNNSDGKFVNTVKTLVEFTVDAYNNPPEVVSAEKAEIQGQISKLSLQAKVAMDAATFDISDLFEDKDGDELTLTVLPGSSGLKFDLSGDNLEVSGTPSTEGDFSFTITAADVYKNTAKTTFTLPTIADAPVANNPLADLLVGETLYRFNADWVDVNDVENNNDHQHAKPDCWALRFTSDHKILEAGTNHGEHLIEDADFKVVGYWAQRDDNIEMTFDGEGSSILSLNEDKSDAAIPRLHLNVTSQKTKIAASSADGEAVSTTSVNEPMTFFIGAEAAAAYWQQAETHVVVKGQLIVADANSRLSNGEDQYEPDDMLDAGLHFNMSCEDLGFEADEGGMHDPFGHPSYHWTEKVPYDFYLLNSKFDHEMFKAAQSQPGLAFTNSDKSVCGVDFDYTQETKIHPGESVVIFANPREGFNAEEFIINTYVDRNDTIVPQASLEIDEAGIFVNEGDDHHIQHYRKDANGNVILSVKIYTGTWSEWKQRNITLIAYQVNGNTAYQGFEQDPDDGEIYSFTVWTDGDGTLKLLSAGTEVCENGDDSCESWIDKETIYATEAAAEQAVEAVFDKSFAFEGTTWKISPFSNRNESYNLVFGETITATFSDGSTSQLGWNEIASVMGMPACISTKICTIAELNSMVEQDDEGKKYHVYWEMDVGSENNLSQYKVPLQLIGNEYIEIEESESGFEWEKI